MGRYDIRSRLHIVDSMVEGIATECDTAETHSHSRVSHCAAMCSEFNGTRLPGDCNY